MILKYLIDNIYSWFTELTFKNHFQFVMVFLVLVMAFHLLSHNVRGGKRLKDLPGPMGLPIFGYLPFLQTNIHLSLNKLAAKYGSIYQFYLGNQLVVILNHHRIIKDAFSKEELSGRPITEFTQILGGYGIVNTEGELWKEQRRFVHKKMGNFGARNGFNRDVLENVIMVEVNSMLDLMASKNGQPYSLHHILASSLSNIICSMLMKVRFEHDDPRFLRFLHLMDEGLRLFSVAAPASYIPFLRHVPGINKAYHQIVKNRDEMFAFFREMVEEHKATRDPTVARDFVDEYLMEIDKQTNNNQEEDGQKRRFFSEAQLLQVIGDLFSTGLEPVKDTLQWALLYMISNPHIQVKIQEELDDIVGQDRLPSLTDLPNLPYTNATVLEVLRSSNVLGIGSSRRATQDTVIQGYKIPKDANVVPLIWNVHMNPDLWKNPEIFDPSRFIDDNGRVIKPDYFIPFSSGRRMCIGEVLAKTEIFLFLSSILHRFTLRASDNSTVPKLDRVTNINQVPSQFQVSAISRTSTV